MMQILILILILVQLKPPSYGFSRTAVYLIADRTILQHILQIINKVFILICQTLSLNNLEFQLELFSYKLLKKKKEHKTTIKTYTKRYKCKSNANMAMREPHYSFSNMNFNSVSALKISILFYSLNIVKDKQSSVILLSQLFNSLNTFI